MVDPKDAARRLMIRNAREQAELEARRALAQAEGRRLAQRILKEIPGDQNGERFWLNLGTLAKLPEKQRY